MPPNKNKRANEDSPDRRSKRRRCNEEEEEEEREKEPVSKASSKKASSYGGGQKPAELFRKDLISAMKLPDSEPLAPEDYLLIQDTWKQEWERGVQVPVNDVALRTVDIREVTGKQSSTGDFKIPKKFLHSNKDETYQLGMHELTGMAQMSEQVVRYDLDDLDVSWLRQVNEHREEVGDVAIYEWTMERVIEELEHQCHENMENKKKTEEGLGIEYDEDIVCEICQSPDSEDTNEMVFCDGCDICVHQACYGIQTVPEGSWLCRTCALGIKPACILCPKVGGAMKSTRSGTKWAHVSCAIWIPEVTIGCVEKMEPVTKISQIPASRWALVCCVCKERNGACIQCSVKSCKTAFHVTCAISEKLEMKTVLVEEKNHEDVKLKAYCPKHSKNRERHGSESDPDSPRKSLNGTPIKDKHMSEEEMATLRAERLQKLEEQFYNLVHVSEIATKLDFPKDVVDHIYVYWKLKRRSLFNKPLLTPKTEEADLLEKQQEDSLLARMKMFVHLRQDLERVRNLSYMISRREKMKRQFNSARESVFYAALDVLTDKSLNLSTREVERIVRTYKDIPPPYSVLQSKSRSITPSLSRAASITSSRHSSIEKDPDVSKRQVSLEVKQEQTDSVASRKTRTESVKDTDKESDSGKVTETPKSRRGRPKCKLLEGEDIKKEGDENLNDSMVDVGTEDETIVNTYQGSTTTENDKTLVQSADETASAANNKTSGKNPKDTKIKPEARRSVGRPKKNLKLSPDKVDTPIDVEVDSRKPGPRKNRTRSSLPEIVDVESVDEDGDEGNAQVDSESDSVEKAASKETRSKSVADKRDRRYSSVVRLTEKEKEELVEKFPSARNVSDHIKTELTGYLRNNKLVVSNKLRQKVQTTLLNGKRRNRFGSGIIIDQSQRKIDSFFVKSPPQCGHESYKSPAKTVSRVLNELSPTRDRFEANNIERTTILRSGLKVSDCHLAQQTGNTPSRNSNSPALSEKSFEGNSPSNRRLRGDNALLTSARERLFEDDGQKRQLRSRESTPESNVSSVRSYGSSKRTRVESPHLRTRSITPLSGGKDSDESESENICGSDSKRLRR